MSLGLASTAPPPLRRYVWVTLVLSLVWLILAWVASTRYVEWRAQLALGEAREKIADDMADIAAGLERNLVIFHGIPAIVARNEAVQTALRLPAPDQGQVALKLEQRRVKWPQVPALAELNLTLAATVKDIGALSVIWVMNPAGDCIAASNSATKESFVGVNYSDRAYFKAAMAGRLGRQFAVGRATKVPGLFFSAPVFAHGRLLGVVGGKIDLPYLASWVNQANAFVTDVYGVIIQAQDKTLEMRAVPGAAVKRLTASERRGRYLRDDIAEIAISPWTEAAYPGLFQFNGTGVPMLMVVRDLATEDLSVTVLQPVPALGNARQDQHALLALAAVVGLLSLVSGAAVLYYVNGQQYLRRNREHQHAMEFLASHDALTGLFSRAMIDQLIHQGMAMATRGQRSLGVLFLDLDMFKDINDSMGHGVGDLVLQEVARRLRAAVRLSDPVIRHGGDEFVVLLHDLETPDAAARIASHLLEVLREPFVDHGVTFNLSASVGLAMYPGDGDTASMLLRNADSALYRAKANGRADFCFYHASMTADAVAHLALENDLRTALAQGQFVLHYQPQYSLSTGCIIGCEALLRWQHPKQGLLLPGGFIGAAEKSGLIVPLGEWVLREACRQLVAWRGDERLTGFHVAVNLSARQFRKPGLTETVQRALRDSGLPPASLELELTESALMENTDAVTQTLRSLKSMGVGLSIDDFGTGYSSLAYLKQFAPDRLKIDRSFVRDIETDANDLAIVNAIIGLSRSLGFRVIAEGIETESQMGRLKGLGCDEIQGFYFSRPLAPEVFAEFVLRQRETNTKLSP